MVTVGVIANPSSGKDIRRLVARGSVFDNNEKINIVRRALLGLEAVGVERVLFMPDSFRIVPRAVEGAGLRLHVESLEMRVDADQRDSRLAGELLAEADVSCIITLGGDGTNRAVALGCAEVPLVPISTGTNNVFPSMIEGTLAGLAAGLVATGAVDRGEVVKATKRLEVLRDGEQVDVALVDVAFARERFVGARAIWNPSTVRELVLASAEPGSIGLSAIGAHLRPVWRQDPEGLYLRLAAPAGKTLRVVAPIAPGLVVPVDVADYRLLRIGEAVELESVHGSLALDGERELVVREGQRLAVRLTFDGPRVVDVRAALSLAARTGRFLLETG